MSKLNTPFEKLGECRFPHYVMIYRRWYVKQPKKMTHLHLPTFFQWNAREFSSLPKVYRRLPKIAEDFQRLPKIAEDFRRLLKIAEDFLLSINHDKVNRKCVTSHNLNTSWCRELSTRNGVSLKTLFCCTHQLFYAEKKLNFYLIGF